MHTHYKITLCRKTINNYWGPGPYFTYEHAEQNEHRKMHDKAEFLNFTFSIAKMLLIKTNHECRYHCSHRVKDIAYTAL